MFIHYTLGLFFLVSHMGCGLGENCFYDDPSSGSVKSVYCINGCCGDDFNQYCCVNVGAIVGGVIGFLIFVGIIITISCLCCSCCQPARQWLVRIVSRTIRNCTKAIEDEQQPGHDQTNLTQNDGLQLMEIQSPTENVDVQSDATAGYVTGPDTYQSTPTSPPLVE
ncbi:hypothetical protein ACJMK2_020840 [Sinanodonta woodiana]|uniref:Uncharacterized protein n=1 Tax=Sinanodonta woodiana TaxID=1069815 RepID=A0ABD3U340_SINWO